MQGVYLLDLELMRKILIFGLALSLFVAGFAPLSACALLSSNGWVRRGDNPVSMQSNAPPIVQGRNTPEAQISPVALPRRPRSRKYSSLGFRLDRPLRSRQL